MLDTHLDVIDRHLRLPLKKLLAQCTDGQKTKFNRIFGSIETMDESEIVHAIALCERTIRKNIENK